jgi:quinol-cytochrome oxidoreductase complex cytochrome b subunit
MNRFKDEVKIIPKAAWAIGIVLCVVIPLFLLTVAVADVGPGRFINRDIPVALIIAIACIFAFTYILIIGYIAADSRRRGMRSLLWVLLAIFTPSAIGIILYFILRDPFFRACSQCGTTTDGTFIFCPTCGVKLVSACPGCGGAVQSGWAHCAKCGKRLQPAT